MARKTKEDARQTRENILSAALDIIYEKGYARTTFVDIANHINLSKGAVYWHFKSKPDLFLALARELEDRIEKTLHDVFNKVHTPGDLNQMLLKMIELIAGDDRLRKYYKVIYYRMEWTDDLLSIREFFDQQENSMLFYVTELLRTAQKNGQISENVDIQPVSKALFALVGGLLGLCLTPDDGVRVGQLRIVRTGLNTFFDGLNAGRLG